jgi:hypothetical protein
VCVHIMGNSLRKEEKEGNTAQEGDIGVSVLVVCTPLTANKVKC